jgi:hypothetical protein
MEVKQKTDDSMASGKVQRKSDQTTLDWLQFSFWPIEAF